MGTITPLASSIWKRKITDVSIGQIKDVDQVSLTTFRVQRFMITLYNKVNLKTVMREYTVSQDQSNLNVSCFGIVGNSINHSIDFIEDGGFLKIRIENKDSFNFEVDLIRVAFGQ
jgi:hypothetical protein